MPQKTNQGRVIYPTVSSSVEAASSIINREHWLQELGRMSEPLFKGFNIGQYRISCSWPSMNALGSRVRRLGECHHKKVSKGDLYEIFITPLIDDSVEVGGIVLHEMAHIAAGVGTGHGKEYVRVCKHVGLTRNKPTQAAPGDDLTNRLKRYVERLGGYPHKAIVHNPTLKQRKKTSTGIVCRSCGCKMTIGLKWLSASGLPTCGCGQPMESKDAVQDTE